MEIKNEELIQVKKTKSVEICGSEKVVKLTILGYRDSVDWQDIYIPIRSVFQVKRGLESYIQKFYRKSYDKKTN